MFIYLFVISFVTQITVADSHVIEPCKRLNTQWFEGDTKYIALEYRGEVYAYAVCKAGLGISSTTKVRCINGWWESPLPRCKKISTRQCESLSASENVVKSCAEGAPTVNSVCNFRCVNKQYQLIGSSQRRCLQGLQWSGRAAQCIPISGNPLQRATNVTTNGRNTYNRSVTRNNPCHENKGGCDHICNFQSGYIQCMCRAGFILQDGKKCAKIKQDSVPISTYNYSHNVHPFKEDMPSKTRSVVKVNLCEANNGGCDQICNSTLGYPLCSCQDGYRMLENGRCAENPPERPVDVTTDNRNTNSRNVPPTNLCSINNGGCDHDCNFHSGYVQCSCRYGYVLKDHKRCAENPPERPVDVTTGNRNTKNRNFPRANPCNTNNGDCDHVCNFEYGYVQCSCRSGYFLQDDKRCVDIDECLEGHSCRQYCHNTNGSYFCSCREGFMSKNIHYCEDIDECAVNNGGCSNECINSPGSYYCSCPNGYRLNGGKTCIDVDECLLARTNPCNQMCNNTVGSYFCSCKPGFILKNRHECEGCRKNSYKSEKDIACIECPPNSVTDSEAKASIADCLCSPGFLGDPSRNIPCDDIDECLTNKFGCSDTCVNTPGGAHCSCPPGFELKDDAKTCVDTDECSTKNGGCQMLCQNSVGSFTCSCSTGYLLSEDKYSCDDIDECEINNGDCSNECNNFPGGHYCSCPEGYHLNVEGKICIAVRCPAIAVPHHSTMRCFPKSDKTKKQILKPNDENSSSPTDYPVDTVCRFKCNTGYDISSSLASAECLDSGRWNASAPHCIVSHCPLLAVPDNGDVYPPECTKGPVTVKQKCYFTCNPGYHLDRKKSMLKCKNSLTWSSEPPSCEQDKIVPFISCPDDLTIDLKENESSVNVTIPRPVTNMDDIEVYPDWITLEELISFPSGETDILFTASSIKHNATTHCIMTINIIDKESPVFVRCPESFGVDGVSSRGILVSWDEPIADDNVDIQSISTNLEPNSTLTAGIHYVEYIAKDAAGNVAQCSFQINITRAHCGDLNDPENGKANCMDWLLGKLCRPACEVGYERDPGEPNFFACGDSGAWIPTDSISPCLPECMNGTAWSSTSETCEEIDVI